MHTECKWWHPLCLWNRGLVSRRAHGINVSQGKTFLHRWPLWLVCREYVMNPTDLEDFTVFLKTLVTFSTFNINLWVKVWSSMTRKAVVFCFLRRNIRDETNFSCRYHKETAPRCPIFRIGDILDSLETNRTALHSDVITQSCWETRRIEVWMDYLGWLNWDSSKVGLQLRFQALKMLSNPCLQHLAKWRR